MQEDDPRIQVSDNLFQSIGESFPGNMSVHEIEHVLIHSVIPKVIGVNCVLT